MDDFIYQLNYVFGTENVKILDKMNLQYPLHMHRCYEFILVLDGSLAVRIEKEEYTISAGDMIMIKPNLIHSIDTKEQSRSMICIFSAEMIMAVSDSIIKYRMFSPVLKSVPGYYRELLENMDEKMNLALIKGGLYSLAGLFYDQLDFTSEERDVRDVYLLRKIFQYVEENIESIDSIAEIAERFNYSNYHLSRYFYDVVGIHLTTYINWVRISHACYLLQNHAGTMTEIAHKCGYKSSTSFNRNFRKNIGCSPTEYREKNVNREKTDNPNESSENKRSMPV